MIPIFFFFAEEGSHNPEANTTAMVRKKHLSFTSGASVEDGIGVKIIIQRSKERNDHIPSCGGIPQEVNQTTVITEGTILNVKLMESVVL